MSTVFMRLADLSEYSPYVGVRHQNLWSLSKNMARCGITFEEACVMLQIINRGWKQPKAPEEVVLACTQAYGGLK
jgi:hypothetical protein